MKDTLSAFLAQRPESSAFVLRPQAEALLREFFPTTYALLPRPYKIFFADEGQAPLLGFPAADSPILTELDSKLDRWISEEVARHLDASHPKEKVQLALSAYVSHVMRLAENAMSSNLLADYHGVFWLIHTQQTAKHFCGIPRKIGLADTQLARTHGDKLKYRIFSRWGSELRNQMNELAARLRPSLEGDELRGVQFLKLLHENVLIATEEFIGPDLRELKSYVNGYLQRDFAHFRAVFDRFNRLASDLYRRDAVVQGAARLLGASPEEGPSLALLLHPRFQRFLFDHPQIEPSINREEREHLELVLRRVSEFSILHQLRRGVTWMTTDFEGNIVPSDRRSERYSRTTRPMDFGRSGVVDPMVWRFGLMYDIASFSETLGTIARGGRKGELTSYRQMLLFQRKLESIATRHQLQFEKFLGDGAFYTTRRALRLVHAAADIQQTYREARRNGFAFDKGIRIALNYGYYRLLPMKGSPDSEERSMEFYGPGVVELSRLTTGKATREILEIQGFLVAHGYDVSAVQQFFAPLSRGVDVIDHRMHQREFYAYLNSSGHLVNEGIVASAPLLQQLSDELAAEAQPLTRLRAPWGTYIGFAAGTDKVEMIGMRIIGTVSLKGLDNVEVAEIVPFVPGEAVVEPLDSEAGDPLLRLLRHDFHEREDAAGSGPQAFTA